MMTLTNLSIWKGANFAGGVGWPGLIPYGLNEGYDRASPETFGGEPLLIAARPQRRNHAEKP
jgi:hypothetical protein